MKMQYNYKAISQETLRDDLKEKKNNKKNNNCRIRMYSKKIILCLLLLAALIYFKNENVFALDKPTYSDMIKNKYGNEISDSEAASLAAEESTVKEAYVNGISTFAITEDDLSSNGSYYGKYPSGYTGAINYRRKNFLLTSYSLRDLNSASGKQPLIAGLTSTNNYSTLGFNIKSWSKEGMTSVNTIKWILNQFEVKKLLRVYEDVDYLILSSINNGTYDDLVEKKSSLAEVINLIGVNGLSDLSAGDLLLNYDEEKKKVNYVGIYLGTDEADNHYSLSPNKLVYNSDDYAMNVWALSYVNSTNVYAQNVANKINLVSGTKYNYGIKLKFLKA